MDIIIYFSFLLYIDLDVLLVFYCDMFGFEVCKDVGYNGMCWIIVGLLD